MDAKTRRRWPLETGLGNVVAFSLLGAVAYLAARWNVVPWAGLLHGFCVLGIAWCGCNIGILLSEDDDEAKVSAPEWAQVEGEEWRRVPSTTLIAYHPDDDLWIAEDLTRRGCWESGPTPARAWARLKLAQRAYDDAFGVQS